MSCGMSEEELKWESKFLFLKKNKTKFSERQQSSWEGKKLPKKKKIDDSETLNAECYYSSSLGQGVRIISYLR